MTILIELIKIPKQLINSFLTILLASDSNLSTHIQGLVFLLLQLTCCFPLQTYGSLQDVLVSFGRRVLCYPLYRHFDMVSAAVSDVASILRSGEWQPARCALVTFPWQIFTNKKKQYYCCDLEVEAHSSVIKLSRITFVFVFYCSCCSVTFSHEVWTGHVTSYYTSTDV